MKKPINPVEPFAVLALSQAAASILGGIYANSRHFWLEVDHEAARRMAFEQAVNLNAEFIQMFGTLTPEEQGDPSSENH